MSLILAHFYVALLEIRTKHHFAEILCAVLPVYQINNIIDVREVSMRFTPWLVLSFRSIVPDAKLNSAANGSIFEDVYGTKKMRFYLEKLPFQVNKPSTESLDDLCHCHSQLCQVQNLILTRIVPFSLGLSEKNGILQ